MTSSRGFLVALLGAGTLILFTPIAHASAKTETKTIQVRAEYTEPMPGFDGVQCRGLADDEPWCQAVVPGPVTFTGTIAGEAQAESAGPTTTLHAYDGPDVFEHAVVEGCGEGGLTLDTFDGDFDFADTRVEDQSTGVQNKWRIRPGSGTGTLLGISGEGENHWRPYWTETGERWGRGVYTGTITCRVSKNVGRAPRTETRTIPVRSEVTAPLSELEGAQCRGVATKEPWCKVNFATEMTLTGTMSGLGSFRDGAPTRGGHHTEGSAVFEHLTVDGCGEGPLVFDAVGDFDFADTRLDDLSTGAKETWRVRPGTGGGGLTGVVGGEVVNDLRAHWTESEQWARGVITGTITCEVPVNESTAGGAALAAGKSGDAARANGAIARANAQGGDTLVLAAAAEREGSLPKTGPATWVAAAGAMLLALGLAARRLLQ